jgi:hypothetical protein
MARTIPIDPILEKGYNVRLLVDDFDVLMVWMFFAIGPGSVFGNMAFGEPNIGYDQWLLGMPSIWAWQIIWWALGVGVVWFLANKLRMSTEPEIEVKSISSE